MRRRSGVRLLVVLLLIAIASCAESPSSEFPETTMFVSSTIDSHPVAPPDILEVTEPCPESNWSASSADGTALFAESSRLEPMLGVVLAYGNERPEEFGSSGLIWHSDGDASVFISFTGRLDEHRSALTDIVEFADELVVCQVALPGWASQALSLSLSTELAGRFQSISQGGGPVEIVLPAHEETLAGDLVDRFGDAVKVTVGVLRFPIADASPVCSELIGEDPPAGLKLAITPMNIPLVSSGVEPLDFEIQLTNESDKRIQFTTGVARGTILDATGKVVGSSAYIAIAELAVPIDIAPGASGTVAGVFGLASCEPNLGYVLPPGVYGLVGTMSYNTGSGPTQMRTPSQVVVVA